MRLATFNLLHGRSLSDGNVHADRVAAAVADLDADVLGLQEVDRAQPRSGLLDLTAIAAEAMGAPAHRFAAAVVGTPGEKWQPWRSDDDNAHPLYGIALISRWPVLRWQITQLPAAPVRSPVWIPGPGGGLMMLKDEPRVLIAAVIDAPTGPMTVANTHLSFIDWWNGRQLRQLMADVADDTGPVVLMGDLNMGPERAGRITGMRPAVQLATFPADAPTQQLDHVLLRGGVRGSNGEAVRLPVSDHRALGVDLVRAPDAA